MLKTESIDIEQATTHIQAQPDNKTRRYDRQLRLWAASGQAALESARLLVISASATSTSILKNLVLPGIGHFTILDPKKVTPADAGNNFFLNGHSSIGKFRAEEAVSLLRELNDSVDGIADLRNLDDILAKEDGREWIQSFSLVIAHNLDQDILDTLSQLLWENPTSPSLIVHNGALPKTYAEKQAFKANIRNLSQKLDEENFEEAEAQAFRLWSESPVPSDISATLNLPRLDQSSSTSSTAFHALLQTLRAFINSPESSGCLPLTSTLPDMKTDTESYVKLQIMYKEQAKGDNALFKTILKKEFPDLSIDEAMVDAFVKNAHHIKVLRGRRWGTWDKDPASLGPANITEEALRTEVQSLVGQGVELPEQLDDAIGEIARAPTADLPNSAAFLGGMVAQEAIKMITKQYVPVNGYCVIDLVETWTGIVGQP
ncbi:hypothetical protein PHLCEN_2v6398 [Hermanssonia centrifuga]|uniref:THIF-type NAD/FAD binding fold domain-containing protein n=1 Tax=Hermanssonia centrifuga TaxID=98765 RepID=A0A2R6P061_9APHY|nr:hypothetical protein PHLCEN_2v6398 [Hermanssonia centrifuga]